MSKTTQGKDEVATNQIKAPSSICNPTLPDLSLVLRAGLGSSNRDLEDNGAAGLGSLSDLVSEN